MNSLLAMDSTANRPILSNMKTTVASAADTGADVLFMTDLQSALNRECDEQLPGDMAALDQQLALLCAMLTPEAAPPSANLASGVMGLPVAAGDGLSVQHDGGLPQRDGAMPDVQLAGRWARPDALVRAALGGELAVGVPRTDEAGRLAVGAFAEIAAPAGEGLEKLFVPGKAQVAEPSDGSREGANARSTPPLVPAAAASAHGVPASANAALAAWVARQSGSTEGVSRGEPAGTMMADLRGEGLPALTGTAPQAALAEAAAFKLAAVPGREQPGQKLLNVLGERISMQAQQGVQHAVIRLDPYRAGTVLIELRHEAGVVNVHLSASHTDVVRQLQAISEGLRQELASRQFNDVNVQVSAQRTAQHEQGGQPRDGRTPERETRPGAGLAQARGEGGTFELAAE